MHVSRLSCCPSAVKKFEICTLSDLSLKTYKSWGLMRFIFFSHEIAFFELIHFSTYWFVYMFTNDNSCYLWVFYLRKFLCKVFLVITFHILRTTNLRNIYMTFPWFHSTQDDETWVKNHFSATFKLISVSLTNFLLRHWNMRVTVNRIICCNGQIHPSITLTIGHCFSLHTSSSTQPF